MARITPPVSNRTARAPQGPGGIPQLLAPTPEQEAIIEASLSGTDLVIEAGAGTGKTSTLRLLANAKGRESGTYLAYNKAIADDAAGSFPRSVRCSTAHSLAFRQLGYRYQHRLNGPRIPAHEAARLLQIRESLPVPLEGSSETHLLRPKHLARLAMETVAQFCYSAQSEIQAWMVPPITGLGEIGRRQVQDWVAPLAREAWADLCAEEGALKFSHDCYLKMWQLSDPRLSCDYVLLDEAQDANPVIAAVVERQTDAQTIMVGDAAQQIYAWRGAVDAMADFEGARFPLTQSFRFGPAIAEEANKWLTLLESGLRLRGYEIVRSQVAPLTEPKAVLCRTNAETVEQAMEFYRAGLSAAIVGDGLEVRRLAEAAIPLKQGIGSDHPELFLFHNWDEVRTYAEEETAGQDLRTFVRLIDRYSPEGVIATINQLVPETSADVILSTAHKAKGREWKTVQIADDFPNPANKEGEQRISEPEARLAYVAVTRAKLILDRFGLAWVDNWLP